MDHKSHEAMRAYLLGLLSNDQAARLEEEYFVNRAFFLRVQSEETALIADYLDGRLRGREKQSFETRYLTTPELRNKVEQLRRQRGAYRPAIRPFAWKNLRLGFAVALAFLLGLATWAYYSRLRDRTNSSVHVQGPVQPDFSSKIQLPAPREFAIYLSPGIKKGASATQIRFPQPAPGETIKLIMELPGESTPVQATAQIFQVNPNGTLSSFWISPHPILSELNYGLRTGPKPTPTGGASRNGPSQAISVSLPDSLFKPGDYLVKVSTPHEKIPENYGYRVVERE